MRSLDEQTASRRVVLDTNVLVSALLTPAGNPNTVLQAVLDRRITLVYSADTMTEYRSVLSRARFGFDARDVSDLLTFFEVFGDFVESIKSDGAMPDESDRAFLDAATTAGAVLITGNTKHFPRSQGVQTPAECVGDISRA